MWQKNAIVGQKTHLFLLKFACFSRYLLYLPSKCAITYELNNWNYEKIHITDGYNSWMCYGCQSPRCRFGEIKNSVRKS